MTPIKRQEIIAAYVFMAPWLIGFLVFLAGPMAGAVLLSLYEWNGIGAIKWRGLANYTRAFGDFDFWQSLRVTSTFVFTALPARVVVALAILFARVLNPEVGLINRFLELIGIAGPGWLFSQQWALPGLGLMFLWQSGAAMILYIIGLEAIPGELLEAAAIDGAGAWRRFLRITLPLLTPIILFNLIVGVIGNFQYFAPVFVMTQGGPNKATLFFVFNVYRTAFQYFEFGYASSLTVVLFFLIALMTFGLLRSSRSWVFYRGAS